ncbi:MAG TPA: NAD(P)H-hydrate dehydratase [Actinomycetota bacterium]|nr:NAD(P)H-hydrate dehydratase [Actinomycetota bacterium]
MKPVLSPEQMSAVDKAAEAAGVSTEELMDQAGWAVAREARGLMGGIYGTRPVIVCGKGNNAGDGFVAARRLRQWGAIPTVVMTAEPATLKGAALAAYEALGGVATQMFDGGRLRKLAARSDVVIDAIVGTGFKGELTGNMASAAAIINESQAPVLSVDIPSGVSGETGRVEGQAVFAEVTVTLGALKHGLLLLPGRAHAGRVVVADIGIPDELLDDAEAFVAEASDIAGLIPPRPPDAHKRSVGKVLVVAGSAAMPGAAALTAMGAFRMGAGLVRIAVPESIAAQVGSIVPEALVSGLPETNEGNFDQPAASAAAELAGAVDAVVVGPGIGRSEQTRQFLFELAGKVELPFVIDADAISLFAESPTAFSALADRSVITPHEGELARVLGVKPEDVSFDRMGSVRKAADLLKTSVLLKGSYTLVSDGAGSMLFFSTTGGPVLATAGSGDVLAGMVGALAAQMSVTDAALVAAFIHGAAGDALAAEVGESGVTASDIADAIPPAIAGLKSGEDLE